MYGYSISVSRYYEFPDKSDGKLARARVKVTPEGESVSAPMKATLLADDQGNLRVRVASDFPDAPSHPPECGCRRCQREELVGLHLNPEVHEAVEEAMVKRAVEEGTLLIEPPPDEHQYLREHPELLVAYRAYERVSSLWEQSFRTPEETQQRLNEDVPDEPLDIYRRTCHDWKLELEDRIQELAEQPEYSLRVPPPKELFKTEFMQIAAQIAALQDIREAIKKCS